MYDYLSESEVTLKDNGEIFRFITTTIGTETRIS